MTRLLNDSELFNLIARIVEDESRTKSSSIESIRKLIKLTEDDE